MAFGSSTINDFGGAASDLLGGQEKAAGLRITAGGQRITAAGTRISANSTRINSEGFDLQALANEQRAKGDEAEAQQYGLASGLAGQNATYTEASTAIQQMQQERSLFLSLGSTRAALAGSGLSGGGSGMDILRDSASQGALTKAVLGQQGAITEAGYKEEAQSYNVMQNAAVTAAGFEREMGTKETSMGVEERGIADQQDALAGRQDALAGQYDALASKTQKDSYITGALKAVAGVATLFADPLGNFKLGFPGGGPGGSG